MYIWGVLLVRRLLTAVVLLVVIALLSTRAHATVGCGTDTSGNPTDNTVCGASGANAPNPYASEGGFTTLTGWCGGSLPGSCTDICGGVATNCTGGSACSTTALTSGTFSAHNKYYISANLTCATPATVAFTPNRYVDVSLNGLTISGVVHWNNGLLRGFHLFDGTLICTGSINGCEDLESFGGGAYTCGGGDQIFAHHLTSSPGLANGYNIKMDAAGADTPSGNGCSAGVWTEYPIRAFNNTFTSVTDPCDNAIGTGVVSVTNGSSTVTWVSGFGGTGFTQSLVNEPFTVQGTNYRVSGVAANGATLTVTNGSPMWTTNANLSLTMSCSTRQHAGFYATGFGPIEAFNNQSQCTQDAPVCQQIEILSANTNGSYPHNNWGYVANLDAAIKSNDGGRPILIDQGSQNAHVQYNDLWPFSTNGTSNQTSNGSTNRAIRLRDAIGAEVDHNYMHGVADFGIHSGDDDIGSGYGQNLNQNIHDNNIELAGGSALYDLAQQGITLNNNNYLCAAVGCGGSLIVNMANNQQNFGTNAVIDSVAKTLTEGSGNWYIAPAIKAGSNISLTGFANGANNATWNVASVPGGTSYTQVTLSDPTNLLVSETCNSGCHWGGITAVTLKGVANSNIGVGLTPKVQLNQPSGQPQVTLTYCGTPSLTVVQLGSGSSLVNSCGGGGASANATASPLL